MTIQHDHLDTRFAALAAARTLAPDLTERARESEALGTLSPDLVAAARTAGLFGLATPRALGGSELEPAAIVEVIEELSRADGSAGWSILIGNSTAFMAWLEPSVAIELIAGRENPIGAAVFAPLGRLSANGSSEYLLDGLWPFSSGCRHADWFIGGAVVTDGDGPRTVAGRGLDWRMAVVPASDVAVVDDWDVLGLRGTGSHTVTATRVRVPDRCTMAPVFEPARHDGPLWRLPFFTLAGITLIGFPLGVARRALDEFVSLAPAKYRGPGPISDDGDVQVALTRAEGALQSARALAYDTIGAMWDTACAGDVPPDAQRARFLLAGQQAMRAAVRVVDDVFSRAGSGALRTDDPIQRCYRDVHAAAAHVYFSSEAEKRYAKTCFDIDTPSYFF